MSSVDWLSIPPFSKATSPVSLPPTTYTSSPRTSDLGSSDNLALYSSPTSHSPAISPYIFSYSLSPWQDQSGIKRGQPPARKEGQKAACSNDSCLQPTDREYTFEFRVIKFTEGSILLHILSQASKRPLRMEMSQSHSRPCHEMGLHASQYCHLGRQIRLLRSRCRLAVARLLSQRRDVSSEAPPRAGVSEKRPSDAAYSQRPSAKTEAQRHTTQGQASDPRLMEADSDSSDLRLSGAAFASTT
jgi:hypothetical protein